MELKDIAKKIKDAKENIILVYAFNGTGKTRLSREYKDITKDADGNHSGVYYNAFSEVYSGGIMMTKTIMKTLDLRSSKVVYLRSINILVTKKPLRIN